MLLFFIKAISDITFFKILIKTRVTRGFLFCIQFKQLALEDNVLHCREKRRLFMRVV